MEHKTAMNCSTFEDNLSDFLEKQLNSATYMSAAAHALQCPLCHSLLNDVKDSIAACHSLSEALPALTPLEAKILESTLPEANMVCTEFEEHLTDYLDGFLPAGVFHRWERHAALCDDCTDLPGMVVRSLATIVEYKLEELPVPAGLNQRILAATSELEPVKAKGPSLPSRIWDAVSGIRIPLPIPQLAPVAMMLLFAFLFISQGVSADGTLSDVYNKSLQIAEQSYRQSSEALNLGNSGGGEAR